MSALTRFDVIDFNRFRKLAAMSALVKGVLFFDEVAGVSPPMVVSDRVGTFAGTPSGLSARQFLPAQFATTVLAWRFQTALIRFHLLGANALQACRQSHPRRIRLHQF